MLTRKSVELLMILGRRDHPTDAVHEYCNRLAAAVEPLGPHSTIFNLIPNLLSNMRSVVAQIRDTRGRGKQPVAVLQHTHLMWSRRGYSFLFFFPIFILRLKRVPIVVIIHDPMVFGGTRSRDRVRDRAQALILTGITKLADKSFLTVHPTLLAWTRRATRVGLLPVGSNIGVQAADSPESDSTLRIFVFGATHRTEEWQDILHVFDAAAARFPILTLTLAGRGTDLAGALISRHSSHPERIKVLGLVSEETLSSELSRATLTLFLRGGLSTRRTTAVAAIAHRVPIVAYEDFETGWPMTEAGAILIQRGDVQAAAEATIELLEQPDLRKALKERNQEVFDKYFDWPVIGGHFLDGLNMAD